MIVSIMVRNNRIDSIYQDIRLKILTDTFRAGQKLSEIQLSREYECSRTPIREILQRLENDGLIIIKPKSGTYVKNETQKDFNELMQVRASMESLAFSLAIVNPNNRDISKLERIKKEMDVLVDHEPIDMMRFAKIHYQFHLKIVHMSCNSLLIQLFERLNLRSSHMFYAIMDKSLGLDTQKEHQKIIDYLKVKEPEGIRFIKNHLIRKINSTLREHV